MSKSAPPPETVERDTMLAAQALAAALAPKMSDVEKDTDVVAKALLGDVLATKPTDEEVEKNTQLAATALAAALAPKMSGDVDADMKLAAAALASAALAPKESAAAVDKSTEIVAEALAAAASASKEAADVDKSMQMAAQALARAALAPPEPEGPPPAPGKPTEDSPDEDGFAKSAPPPLPGEGPPPAPEKPTEDSPDEDAAAKSAPPPPPPPMGSDEAPEEEGADAKSAPPPPPPPISDRGEDLYEDAAKSSPPPPPPPERDAEGEDEMMPAKSAPPPPRFSRESDEDEGDMPAKSAPPASAPDALSEKSVPLITVARPAMPAEEIAAVVASGSDMKLPPETLAESASFARHFRMMQEKAGMSILESPPRSAAPKWRPSSGNQLAMQQAGTSAVLPEREVMGLVTRMSMSRGSTRQGLSRGSDDKVLGAWADETWMTHDLHDDGPVAIPARKMRKQKTWNDEVALANAFSFDDEEDDEDEFAMPSTDIAEESSFLEESTQATIGERARGSKDVFASTSMGSEEQDSRDSFASHGEPRDRDRLPKIERGMRRTQTAPGGLVVEGEDDRNIGANFKALQVQLREELAMHEQTRAHAQELERKLKLANSKLSSPPQVKRNQRFGVTDPVAYSAPPLPIRKKEKRGVYLPALKTLKPPAEKRDPGDAVLPVVQELLDTQKLSVMSRQDQSRSRVEAFSRLGQVGMSTWDVRRTEKVSRYQDMTAFSDSMWGSFHDWNNTLNSME